MDKNLTTERRDNIVDKLKIAFIDQLFRLFSWRILLIRLKSYSHAKQYTSVRKGQKRKRFQQFRTYIYKTLIVERRVREHCEGNHYDLSLIA